MYSPNSDPGELPFTAFTPTAGDPLGADALRGNLKADIAVIGGGIAGCSAALHAAEKGASVVLLEANAIGWGASGRNAGHVAPASKLTLEEAIRRYGPDHGTRFNEACEAGPDLVFDLIERHGFEADVKRGGIIVAAHSRSAVEELSHRANVQAREGKPVQFLDRAQAAQAIGSTLYLGAYKDERGGSVNSLAYVRGLARSAIRHGARVFEGSRAFGIERMNERWIVRTGEGSVEADRIMICTNAYTDGFWKGLAKSVVPARSYHFATVPLAADIVATLLPGAAAMTDRRRLLIGIRITPDGRLQFNGYGPPVGPDRGADIARTKARIEEIFPQVAPVALDMRFHWSGWMAMTPSGTWKMHELAPGVTAVLGCNGRGVAMGTFLGRDLARHALGTPAGELTIPFEPMRPIPFHFLSPLIARAVARRRDRKDIGEMQILRRQRQSRAGEAI